MEFPASTILVCLALALGQRDLAIERLETAARPESIARNVWLQPELRPILLDAQAASPTLRDLIRFIERQKRVYVTVMLEPALAADRAIRAQCDMRIYTSGLMIAHVRLPSALDAVELVAHELEHVRERLEGIHVAQAFANHRPGVYQLSDGRFETVRARDVGLRVKGEVERAQPLLTTRRVTP